MSKTWEATEIEMEKMVIKQEGDYLVARQLYRFVDSDGNVLDDLESKWSNEKVKLENVPQNILDGISAIEDYLKNKAVNEEGI